MEDRGAVILGGHIQALGIIRILGRIGIGSIVIDKIQKNIARHSKYCRLFYKVSDEDLLLFLTKLGEDGNYKRWVIFPTNDYHVKLLSQNKDVLGRSFIVSSDGWNVVSLFYNKRNTYDFISKINIPSPKTWYPKSEDDLSNEAFDFPCIIKPAVMHDFYRKTKKKVFLCRDRDELIIMYKKALQIIPSDEIIVQEIIPGSGDNQYSACFLFLNGTPFTSLTVCRLRQHPVDFGNATTYAETCHVPEIMKYAERILKGAGYNGLCEVEFKKDARDGSYKFLEVNPRTWKWHSIANKTMTPFIELYFNFLTGNNITPVYGFQNGSFVHQVTDLPVRFRLFFKGDKNWQRRTKPCENAVWARDDIKPWLYEKLYLPELILTR